MNTVQQEVPKKKPLQASKEEADKAEKEFQSQNDFWNNPKDVSSLIKMEPGSFLVLAPPVDRYYNRNLPNPMLKSDEEIGREAGVFINKPVQVVSVGQRLKDVHDIKELDLILIRTSELATRQFYYNNIRFMSFDESSFLAKVTVKDGTNVKDVTNRFSAKFVE